MSIDSQSVRSEQHTEVGFIIARDASILIERWCKRAMEEQPNAKRVHHEALRDQFVDLLAALGRSLAQSDSPDQSLHRFPAIEHGEQRWESGWSLPEVVRDYQILRLVILEYLVETLDRHVRAREVMAIGLALDEAIAASVGMYVSNREQFILAIGQERLEQEKQAKAGLEKWEQIFQHAGWGVAILNAVDHTLQTVNPAFAQMHGYAIEELAGKPLNLCLAPEAHADWLMNAGLVDQNGNHVYESVHIRKDGTRFPVLTHATTVRDEADKPLYQAANFQDITHRKELEESLRRQAEALRQIDQRKDEFLAMLAHELRNPLASLLNAANALRLSGIRDDNVADATDIVERQVKYMVRMVDDLLDVTRISLGKLELRKQRFDLAAAITQAAQISRPLIEARKHELTVHLPAQSLCLEADRARVEQMLVNLLTNAAKYSDPGGKISVMAAREEDWAVLRVRDTGVGIPRDMLLRIFGLFTQLDSTRARSGGGLGIGLTLVHRLVKMHGGEVTAHSDGPGRGSEFVLKLPIGNAQQRPGDSEKDRQTNQVPPRHILLIEDNADGRVTLQRLLQLLGHRVDIAEDGVRGVAAALANRPQVALIDIGLPTMDGYEVAEKIRAELGKKIFLIALTGYGQTNDRRRALEAGFDAHVTKPVDITELSALLAALAPVTS